MRYAIYFTPPASHPLTETAARWLGRDAFSGADYDAVPAGTLAASEVSEVTAAPRRYGFHATLKAPFRLKDEDLAPDLMSEAMHFASKAGAFTLPPLKITRIGSFFALTQSEPSEALSALADDVVVQFDPFRAALGDAERAKRKPERLSERQQGYLERWGYPYVFEEFRFHMTLTGPVEDAEAPRIAEALDTIFSPLLSEPVEFANIALFVEEEPGAPFLVDSLHPLGRVEARPALSRKAKA